MTDSYIEGAAAYDTAIADLFEWHRNNLLNAAVVTLKAAGWAPPDLPAANQPPGGLDELLWGAIYHETMAQSAYKALGASEDSDIRKAIRILTALTAAASALAKDSIDHVRAAEIGYWLMAAMALHMSAAPADLIAEVDRLKRGLTAGPGANITAAEVAYRAALRGWLSDYLGSDAARWGLANTTIWKAFELANPKLKDKAQELNRVWPSESTGARAVAELKKAMAV